MLAALGGLFGGSSGSLLGGIAGGLLGGFGGGGKAKSTTSVTDIPAWQKPYVQQALQGAQGIYGQQQGTPLLAPAQAEYLKTIQGNYLDPSSNPFLKATFDQAARGVSDVYQNVTQPRTDSMFFGPGSMGGNTAYQNTVARNNYGFGQNLADLATQIYGGNYQQERNRQFGAVSGAPEFTSGQSQAAFSPASSYLDVVGRPFGSSQSQPYFQNKGAGLLGGALAGMQFGGMMGGGGSLPFFGVGGAPY